jgi:hypothetical protein
LIAKASSSGIKKGKTGLARSKLQLEKAKKLEALGLTYVQQGEAFEKDKEYSLAIDKYLKVVDILLLLADSTTDYPTWLKLSDKASSYQKKIRSLIATASIEAEKDTSSPQIVDRKVEEQTTAGVMQRAVEPLRTNTGSAT